MTTDADRIGLLTDEINKLNEHLAEVKAQADEAEAEVRGLRAEHADMESRAEKAEEELSGVEERLSECVNIFDNLLRYADGQMPVSDYDQRQYERLIEDMRTILREETT